jgi:hypothetical protein
MSDANIHNARSKLWVRRRVIEKRYNISPRTLDNWLSKRIIPRYKVGGVLLFSIEACDRALGKFEIRSKGD